MAAKRRTGGNCREKTSRSIVIEMQGHNALISNGSMVLLKYKLNNVCDPNRVREPRRGGAQITE